MASSPAYLKPTPKVKAAPVVTSEPAIKRRKKGKPGNKSSSATQITPKRSKKGVGPKGRAKTHVASAEGVKEEPSSEPSDSEEDSNSGSDREVSEEQLQQQFNQLKASAQPEDTAPVAEPKPPGPPPSDQVISGPAPRSHGVTSQLHPSVVAILDSDTLCQGLVFYKDQLRSGRLPGNQVMEIVTGKHFSIYFKPVNCENRSIYLNSVCATQGTGEVSTSQFTLNL